MHMVRYFTIESVKAALMSGHKLGGNVVEEYNGFEIIQVAGSNVFYGRNVQTGAETIVTDSVTSLKEMIINDVNGMKVAS